MKKISLLHCLLSFPLAILTIIALFLDLTPIKDWELAPFLSQNTSFHRVSTDFLLALHLPHWFAVIILAAVFSLLFYHFLRHFSPVSFKKSLLWILLLVCLWLLIDILHLHLATSDLLFYRFILKLALRFCGLFVLFSALSHLVITFFRHHPPKLHRDFFWIIAASLLLELFIFNFRYFESTFYQPQDLSQPIISENLNFNGTDKYFILEANDNYLEFRDLNTEIKNLNFQTENSMTHVDSLELTIWATDEGNQLYYPLTSQEYIPGEPSTQFFRLHFSGKVKDLKLAFQASANTEFRLEKITINSAVPLRFSWMRLAIVTALALTFYLLLPGSFIYRYRLSSWDLKYSALLALIIIAQLFLAWYLLQQNSFYRSPTLGYHYQYQELTDALKKGQLDLGDAPDFLATMANPYDYHYRGFLAETQDPDFKNYRWDTAYYAGKYYVYFGIVPAILLYLPYTLLFGGQLANIQVIFVFIALFLTSVYALLYQLTKKYFPHTPFATYLLLTQSILLASNLGYFLAHPDFYTIPIIAGSAFLIWGFYFYLTAEHNRSLSQIKLFLGSTCLALVAGCRPQILLFYLVLLPLLGQWWQQKKLFQLKNWRQTLSFLTPFLLIAALLMLYNWLRFDNIFEFGARYNLTINDMTRRGWKWDRTGSAIFTYFFQPPVVGAVFPFLSSVSTATNYLGYIFRQATFGGLFLCYPFLLSLISLFRPRRADLPHHPLFLPIILTLVCSVIIAVADVQIAGITPRYLGDFAFMVAFAAAVIWLILLHSPKNRPLLRLFQLFLLLSFFFGLAYSFCLYFTPDGATLIEHNPHFFYQVQNLVQFWR